jgi:uncharacterized oligopeptide transporter (OPT) family protein
MAFAVGVYLPFHLNVPIFLGGVIALFVNRRLDKTRASSERRSEVERMGLLAAAGFITGEALMGIGLAVPVAALHDENAIALFMEKAKDWTPENAHMVPAYAEFWLPSIVFVGIVLALLYKLSFKQEQKTHTAKLSGPG